MFCRATVVIACAALVVGIGCDGPPRFRPSSLGHSLIDVRVADAVIQHGTIGAGQFESQGPSVLVDAYNPLGTPLEVTLGGNLLDGAGEPVGQLNKESLRIPAGGRRTYALVHHQGAVKTATTADIQVLSSQLPKHPEPIRLESPNVKRDGDRVVVRAYLHNDSDKEVRVLVVAGFYDADGKIMKRPFSVIKIPAEWRRPAQFVGPDGSAMAYLFVADQVY